MKKRILFLSDIDSSHTRKWAVSLSQRGYEIGIFSLRISESKWFESYPVIHVFDSDGFISDKFHKSTSSKISYLKTIPVLKKVIHDFQPDIVHAHYATSYGLLGARSGFHPLIISVWGTDIFEFPKKSILHRLFVFNNLKKADFIFSTSEIMKREAQQYVNTKIEVTPFGVDVNVFCKKDIEPFFEPGTKVIGTIKSLETAYGIDVLIRAFAIVKSRFSPPLKLMICGSGTKETGLKELCVELGISSDTFFTGRISPDKTPDYHNQMDIFANLSYQESFGVAVVEAMACEKSVVATNVGGLTEVVKNNVTGILVEPGNVNQAADAMLMLLNNTTLAGEMGMAGRKRVLELYDWKKNLDHIEDLYSEIIGKK
jgi:glycosyltransferase involved in cell wall biosynthesis